MKKTRKIPQRKCIVCGSLKDKEELLRIVKNKEEGILIDESGKLNGRGAYVCKDESCIKGLKKSNKLNQAFKMKIDDDIYEELEAYEVK
ncbi:RNase P modulator RnpM [uncultured Anaerococcus sp.]|uniref:RNase P modulator RnpM n=1 Tax=uncultured Anaerococcus sp. TaxID=293428 RepID=UPI00280C2C37|nr:YlxR family protein [uncultured Anaerococcus sp.]